MRAATETGFEGRALRGGESVSARSITNPTQENAPCTTSRFATLVARPWTSTRPAARTRWPTRPNPSGCEPFPGPDLDTGALLSEVAVPDFAVQPVVTSLPAAASRLTSPTAVAWSTAGSRAPSKSSSRHYGLTCPDLKHRGLCLGLDL